MSSVITPMSPFAETIYRNKYAQEGENWADTASRVVRNVMGPYLPELVDPMIAAIASRKFMPGGRYLYAAGKRFHQTQNCLLMRAGDSREELSDLMMRVSSGLMTGAGIGIVWTDLRPNGAPVKGMGGTSTGPLAFMQMVNEIGRHIMQGGSRRSAIWAGLHWYHADIFDFINMKNWSQDIVNMKAKDFNFPATMDGTNISVILDDDFFAAYDDPTDPMHEHANRVYWRVVEQMLTSAEPGFSVDVGDNAGENLRNAPVTGDTSVLTNKGYKKVSEIVDTSVIVWTGKRWASPVTFTRTQENAPIVKVVMSGGRVIRCEPSHEFLVERYVGAGKRRTLATIDRIKAGDLRKNDVLHVSLPTTWTADFRPNAYTLGWLYGDGSFRGGRAELTLCSAESKACLPFIEGYDTINMKDGRGFIRAYWHRGFAGHSKAAAPDISLGDMPSYLAGLYDADGNWEGVQKRIRLSSKHENFLHDIRRMLENLGIIAHVSKAGFSTYGKAQTYQLVVSADYMAVFADLIPTKRIRPDLNHYTSYRTSTIKVLSVESDGIEDVYCADVQVEEHSFQAEGVIISNCTEITSYDDNDICNLGSVNMANVETIQEFDELVRLGTAFLLCGTEYSLVPYERVADTREKNRRLGLGVMGIAEWLMARGKPYAPDDELGIWLDVYRYSSDRWAKFYADAMLISRPVKVRAIAPTGTIGILAETTTGIEPLFAVAFKRRYLKGKEWQFQYVIDATAKRLMEKGIPLENLITAYEMADNPEQRIAFQAWVQQYVDHGISSTLNLPAPDKQKFTHRQFGNMLMSYLPDLRGVTCYPDGARGGQPITVVKFEEADGYEGYEYQEFGSEQACLSGVCGV